MTSERYHKAARDGIAEILKEANRKECNARDEGGMTPTLWAAFEGHIEALRLLVAKGGDPDKSDYFGNSALHLAAARGHDLCVRFLVKFGCNIWSLDIDRHSARELAAINGRDRILQFLDLAQADQEISNRKKSKLMKERAEKEAEKRLKEFLKRQKSAELRAEKEQKKLMKLNNKTAIASRPGHDDQLLLSSAILLGGQNGKLVPSTLISYKGKLARPSPSYSDIVGTATKRQGSVVSRRALARRNEEDFKVVEIEVDGKKSVRSLTGFRRDSEVMYVSTFDTKSLQASNTRFLQNRGKKLLEDPLQHNASYLRRGRISDVWGTVSKAKSTSDLLHAAIDENSENVEIRENCIADDSVLLHQEPASIFHRPGFGSVAFRKSIAAALDDLPVTQVEIHQQPNSDSYPSTNCSTDSSTSENNHTNNNDNNIRNIRIVNGHNNEELSIGSAGSFARRQMWNENSISEGDDTDEDCTALQRFLSAYNLGSIHPILEAEQIDFEALMLLTENDLAALKLPLGPKRKLLHAIKIRQKALSDRPDLIIKNVCEL